MTESAPAIDERRSAADEHRPRKRRATKRELRAWAWVAGALAFTVPWAAVAASTPVKAVATPGPRTILVRKVTRRIIISPAKPAAVRYVYAGGSAGGSSSVTSGSSGGAPAPTTTSGS